MAMADSAVGLLFKISADDSDVDDKLKKISKAVKAEADDINSAGSSAFLRLGNSLGISESAMGKLSVGLPLVGAAIAGVASVAAGLTAGLFQLAKSASDYGSEIQDLSEKTGLSAETLSSLKIAVETTDASMADLAKGSTILSKTIAEAARGSVDARDKLIRLGIDPKKAINDLDGALSQAFKTINDAPEGVKQTAAAMDAFGKSGAGLIGVVKAADGDIAGMIEKARSLGLVLSTEDARAADEFGDTLAVLGLQFRGVAQEIGRELMPVITSAMNDISSALRDNRGMVSDWADSFKLKVEGVYYIAKQLGDFFQNSFGKAILSGVTDAILAMTGLKAVFAGLDYFGGKQRAENPESVGLEGKYIAPKKVDSGNYKLAGGGSGGGKSGANQVNRDAIQNLQLQERALDQSLRGAIANLKLFVADGGVTLENFQTQAETAVANFLSEFERLQTERRRLEKIGKKGKAAENVDLQFEIEAKAMAERVAEMRRDIAKTTIETAKKTEAESLAILRDSNKQRLDVERLRNEQDLARRAENASAEKNTLIDLARFKSKIVLDELKTREDALKEEQKTTIIDAKEKKRIANELALIVEERRLSEINGEIELRAAIEETVRARLEANEKFKDAFAENEAVKNETGNITAERADVAAENLRREIELNSAGARSRKQALIEIRDLEIENAERRLASELEENERLNRTALEKLEYLRVEAELNERINLIEAERQKIAAAGGDTSAEDAELSKLRQNLELRQKLRDLYAEKAELSEEQFNERRAEIAFYADGVISAESLNAFERDLAYKTELENLFRERQLLSEEEFQQKLAEIKEIYRTAEAERMDENFFGGGEVAGGFEQLDALNERFGVFGAAVSQLKTMVTGAFNSMAQGIGSMVSAWVLGGDQAGASFKKMVATVLAGAAAQAATLAIMELGFAFAAMSPWGAAIHGSPASHFKAAALFGAVALTTAVAGRAMAGDSFKSASNAGATASGGGGGNNRNSTGSPDDPRRIEIDRNQPQKVDVTVHLKSSDSHIVDVINRDYQNNGRTRVMINDATKDL